jgi:hypothetical protein
VTKSDLRCFVALAGMIPAIGYVCTCRSVVTMFRNLGVWKRVLTKEVVVTDVFVGTFIICALCVPPDSVLI